LAVQFILGGSKSGKTEYALKQMLSRSKETNRRLRELYIVPEQYTLQAQEEFLEKTKAKGMIQVEVLSFNRLVYRFYDYLGVANKKTMSEIGKSLLIRKIIEEHLDEFVWLKRHRKRQSFMDELSKIITECYQYGLNQEAFMEYSEKIEDQLLKDKLTDIFRLFHYFQQAMDHDLITGEQAAHELLKRISSIEELKDTSITIDNFYGFTPLQYRLIEELAIHAKHLYICITISSKSQLNDLKNESELYYESKKAISYIRQMIDNNHLIEQSPVFLDIKMRKGYEDLFHLNKYLYHYPTIPFQDEARHIRLVEAKNIQDEVEVVAKRIYQLIYDGKYRMKDFVVLTSDIDVYEYEIKRLFNEYALNFFIDKKEGVLEHPFIQFILSSLLVSQYNYKYEHVFYHLKSIYYGEQDTINKIENYVLSRGIKGNKKWKGQWSELNDEKNQILSALFLFVDRMRKQKKIVDRVKVLYDYLNTKAVYETHSHYIERLNAKNQLQEADRYRRIYDRVMDTFDEFVQMAGEEEVSIKEFSALVESGLSGIKLGQPPPSLDQILVGDISRTRFKENKVVFVLGVNEGKVPLVRSTSQVLTDFERRKLLEIGLEVAPDQGKSLFKEQMNIYKALTRCTQLLHISYARRGEEGAMRPASVFFMMSKLFSKVEIEHSRRILYDSLNWTKPMPVYRYFVNMLNRTDIEDHEKELGAMYHCFSELEGFDPTVFISGLMYKNTVSSIEPFSEGNYSLSVSELEAYASCAYAHYLDYRLQVKERMEYEVTMPDIGILFHKCLELYMKKCAHRNLSIATIEAKQRNKLVDECIKEILEQESYGIFLSSGRNRYLVVKLTRIIKRALWGIENQLKKSLFRPKDIEYNFDGKENQLDTLVMEIAPGIRLFLKGIIDRLDEYETENQLFISIIDYKSGNKTLDFGLIDSGVQLQLFVYLNVAKEIKEHMSTKEVVPSGLYYYQIQDPFIKIEEDETLEGEAKLLRELRPKGLVLHDEKVVRMFDTSITGASSVIPVTMNKSGISSRSSTVTKEEMQAILNFVKKKSFYLGKQIYSGNIQINPYKYEQKSQCDFCKYRSICRFDPSNVGEHYHVILKIDKKDMINRMKGEHHGRSHKNDHSN